MAYNKNLVHLLSIIAYDTILLLSGGGHSFPKRPTLIFEALHICSSKFGVNLIFRRVAQEDREKTLRDKFANLQFTKMFL